MTIELDKGNKDWIAQFIKKHKRKPRILHLSNIANNAYNNAKLLNDCGLENHVLMANDFYAMGCPEWEDADFSDEVTDMWRPQWYHFQLNGFSRPHWFAQGEYFTCIEYLATLCDGNTKKAKDLFKTLGQQNKTVKPINERRLFLGIVRHGKRISRSLLIRLDARFNTTFIKTLFRLKGLLQSKFTRVKAEPAIQNTVKGRWEVDCALVNEFKKEFPLRQDQLSENDFIAYYGVRPEMYQLLSRYDLVIGYAVEGVYPLMFGKPYFAFEHGTIRDIPYKRDTQGRICALTYRKATHVFVTNSDCVSSATFLSPGKHTLINHPYDEDQPLSIENDWQQQREQLLEELDADMLLFHPTRQDWCARTGYADKANDVFLQVFGKLRQQGLRLGLVCCTWGANIEESKKLLAQAEVSDNVRWLKPLGVIAYTKMCAMADIVVDQFKLGSFGGVTFKALASGTPVMTYINISQLSSRYAEPPPIINCQTTAEITQQLSYWYSNRNELAQFGQNGAQWMKKFHGKSETVNAQIAQFRWHFPVN